LITLLLLGKQTVMQSIAVLIVCKSKPLKASLQGIGKNRETSGKQEKSPKEIPMHYCGNEKRCRFVPYQRIWKQVTLEHSRVRHIESSIVR